MGEVKLGITNMEAGPWIEPVLKEYAFKYGTDIMATNPHGKPVAPTLKLPKDKTNIFFWSHPTQKSQGEKMHRVFDLYCQGGMADIIVPADSDFDYLYDGMVAVACVVERNLYILFDMPHINDSPALTKEAYLETLQKILDWAFEEMNGEVNNTTRLGRALAKTAAMLYERQLQAAKRAIELHQADIVTHTMALNQSIADIAARRNEAQNLELTIQGIEAKANQDVVSLKKTKGLKRITTRSGFILAETEMITLKSPQTGLWYKIGEFTIEFRNNAAYVINKTLRLYGEIDHPHVKRGLVCYGATKIQEYYASGDVVMALHGILEILHTYNQGDAFASLDEWPEAETPPEEEKIELPVPEPPKRRTRRTTGATHVRVLSEVLQADGTFSRVEPGRAETADLELGMVEEEETGDDDE